MQSIYFHFKSIGPQMRTQGKLNLFLIVVIVVLRDIKIETIQVN